MPTIALLLLLAAAAADPLTTAEQALRARQPEEVLFALDAAELTSPEARARAAALLADAAALALATPDAPLAVQLCQRALRQVPEHADALAVCSAAALAAQLYDAADDYAARLTTRHVADPRGPMAAARSAAAQGEWARAKERAAAVRAAKPAPALRTEALALEAEAERALAERAAGLSASAELLARLEAAAAKVRAMPPSEPGATPILVSSGGVVVYRTAWCNACKAAEGWLKAKKIPFTSRDVETDPMAAVELAAKVTARGQEARGVPVIDVGGELIHGFDRAALERATKKAGLTK